MFGEGDHSRNNSYSWVKSTWQTKDDLAQHHHVMDRTWNGRSASEYQQQEGVATGVSLFTVRPTLGARMVKEEEKEEEEEEEEEEEARVKVSLQSHIIELEKAGEVISRTGYSVRQIRQKHYLLFTTNNDDFSQASLSARSLQA